MVLLDVRAYSYGDTGDCVKHEIMACFALRNSMRLPFYPPICEKHVISAEREKVGRRGITQNFAEKKREK